MVRRDAQILVGADSTIIEATDAALEILGMSLAELRAMPPGALSLEEDKAGREGFEDAWQEAGRGAIVGAGTVRLLDGRLIRVRYLIDPRPDGTFEVILERSQEAIGEPPRAYTVGSVLSAVADGRAGACRARTRQPRMGERPERDRILSDGIPAARPDRTSPPGTADVRGRLGPASSWYACPDRWPGP